MTGRIEESQFPFYARMSTAGRTEIARLVASRVRPRQQVLARGAAVEGAYLLVGGSLRVYYVNSEGREATLYHVEPGGTCILALTSAFNREPYPAWVEAGPAGGALVRVPTAIFRRLFDTEPEFRAFIFSVLSRRIFALMQTLEEIGSAQMEQRVARLLLRQMDRELTVRASQSAIASELGTAREVVFRALRSLSDQGLARTGRLQIRVIDPAGLRRVGDLGSAGRWQARGNDGEAS